MEDDPKRYFSLLARMRKDDHASSALRSLDIIDTKAGGLAGLIGGFAAASTIILQSLWSHPEMIIASGLIGLSLASLAISGGLCATCLTIMSHFDVSLFSNSEGKKEQERIDAAAKVVLAIYNGRVGRYRKGLFFLFGGVALLICGILAVGIIALIG